MAPESFLNGCSLIEQRYSSSHTYHYRTARLELSRAKSFSFIFEKVCISTLSEDGIGLIWETKVKCSLTKDPSQQQ